MFIVNREDIIVEILTLVKELTMKILLSFRDEFIIMFVSDNEIKLHVILYSLGHNKRNILRLKEEGRGLTRLS